MRKKEYTDDTLTKSYRYLSGGAILQTCSLTDDNDCTTTDKYISLPGGVALTLSPTNPDTTKRTVYSISNFHGDAAITANEQGLPTSSVFLYEPFGQPSSSATFGTNSNPTNATDNSMGWAANPTRKVAGAFSIPILQMGARVYLPTAGRFLQVDPVDGGTANAYVYATDPVNSNDYSGLALCNDWDWGCKMLVSAGILKDTGSKPKSTVLHTITQAMMQAVASYTPTASSSIGSPYSKQKSKYKAKDTAAASYLFGAAESERARRGALPAGPQTTHATISFCAYLCGQIGLAYDGGGWPHLSVGYAFGPKAGLGATIGGGPGRVNTGANVDLSCSWGPINGSVSSDGSSSGTSYSGGVNLALVQLGCSSGASYTW